MSKLSESRKSKSNQQAIYGQNPLNVLNTSFRFKKLFREYVDQLFSNLPQSYDQYFFLSKVDNRQKDRHILHYVALLTKILVQIQKLVELSNYG